MKESANFTKKQKTTTPKIKNAGVVKPEQAKSRKDELIACFKPAGDDIVMLVARLIDEMVNLEGELDKLRGVPLIRISQKNPTVQETTPAAQLYTRLLSRYTDITTKLIARLQKIAIVEDSPLRAYLKTLTDD